LSRFVLMRKLTMLIATIVATATTTATAAIKIHSQVGITGSFFSDIRRITRPAMAQT
jgi:hypothetical protein